MIYIVFYASRTHHFGRARDKLFAALHWVLEKRPCILLTFAFTETPFRVAARVYDVMVFIKSLPV